MIFAKPVGLYKICKTAAVWKPMLKSCGVIYCKNLLIYWQSIFCVKASTFLLQAYHLYVTLVSASLVADVSRCMMLAHATICNKSPSFPFPSPSTQLFLNVKYYWNIKQFSKQIIRCKSTFFPLFITCFSHLFPRVPGEEVIKVFEDLYPYKNKYPLFL